MSDKPARARKSTTKTSPGQDVHAAGPLAGLVADQAPDRATRALLASVPAYQRIAADLRAQIASGQLSAGQPIPSETQMTATYGVSRITVRHAIAELRSAGLIITEHGRASRVRDTLSPSSERLEFNPTIIQTGIGTSVTFRTWDTDGWDDAEQPARYRTNADTQAQHLGLQPAEPVFVYERLLVHTSGVRISHLTYVPFMTADVPELHKDPFRSSGELYRALAATFEIHWREVISAIMPSPDTATALHIPDGVPILIHSRTTLDINNHPLLLEEVNLPAHRTIIANDRRLEIQ